MITTDYTCTQHTAVNNTPFQRHLRELLTTVEVNCDIDIGNVLQDLLTEYVTSDWKSPLNGTRKNAVDLLQLKQTP